jgi:hypothetical protein
MSVCEIDESYGIPSINVCSLSLNVFAMFGRSLPTRLRNLTVLFFTDDT